MRPRGTPNAAKPRSTLRGPGDAVCASACKVDAAAPRAQDEIESIGFHRGEPYEQSVDYRNAIARTPKTSSICTHTTPGVTSPTASRCRCPNVRRCRPGRAVRQALLARLLPARPAAPAADRAVRPEPGLLGLALAGGRLRDTGHHIVHTLRTSATPQTRSASRNLSKDPAGDRTTR